MERVLVLLLVLAVTGAFSALWRARDGKVVPARKREGSPRWAGLPIEAADLARAVAARTPLALVEFTAPDCRPCVATRTMLDEATRDRQDISIHAFDVGEALDLARAHRVMRAPTTLLITEEGHLLGRVAGVPRREELDALLDSTKAPAPV